MTLLALALLLQVDGTLELKKYDSYGLTLSGESAVSSSDGRDSNIAFKLELKIECHKNEGDVMDLDVQIQSMSIKGTWRGQDVTWEKRAGVVKETGGKIPAGLATACEKGVTLTLTSRGAFPKGSGAAELLNDFPIWGLTALAGLACPFDAKASSEWTSDGNRAEIAGASALFAYASKGEAKDGTATVSSTCKVGPADNDEFAALAKGEVTSKATFDLKARRPVSGEYSAKVNVAQGGWKRDFVQKVSFEVKK